VISLLAALGFLTVIPATWSRSPTGREISDSRAYFPVVGLLVGLLMLGLERGAREIFPVYMTAAVLVVALVIVTRGLHLDGLMDTCDGLFGGFSRERRLEIMRDSQVGAFGIAGAVCLLLLRYGALVSLVALPDPGRQASLLLFPMMSRWSMVLVLGAFPYVRSQGLGSPFHQGGAAGAVVVAAGTAVVSAIALGGFGGAGMLAGVSVLAWLLGRYMAGTLGGLTGDTYGAVNEVAEAAALMTAVALLPHGWIEPLPQLLGLR